MSAEKTNDEPEKTVTEPEHETKGGDSKEESILQTAPPSQITITRNRPVSFYAELARKILRHTDHLSLHGSANTIATACTLVEILKRQQIAKVEKVHTGMDTQAYFMPNGTPRWSQPVSIITFELGRDSLAEYVSGYHQRKVIEVFESATNVHNGLLKFEGNQVAVKTQADKDPFVLEELFLASADQAKAAQAFLGGVAGKELDLPNFIKYCSHLLHPLLKAKEFRGMLERLGVSDDSQAKHEEHEDHIVHEHHEDEAEEPHAAEEAEVENLE